MVFGMRVRLRLYLEIVCGRNKTCSILRLMLSFYELLIVLRNLDC